MKLYELEKLLNSMRDEGADNLTEVRFRVWCEYKYTVNSVNIVKNEDGEDEIILDN